MFGMILASILVLCLVVVIASEANEASFKGYD